MAAVSTPARLPHAAHQLGWFAREQLLSCVFPIAVFSALGFSKVVAVSGLPRYDLVLVLCLVGQWLMLRLRLESVDELKAISVFHVIGLAMELHKVRMGSWSYPEPAYLKIGGVPLYSGFMYASVASYMCQAWRRLDLVIEGWPGMRWAVPLAAAVYLNFFTLHVLPDVRWLLLAATFLVFRRTAVRFRVDASTYRMPVCLAYVLIGFAVWVAENVCTRLGAWRYPDQADGWAMVSPAKITSWGLLVIVTSVVVAQLKLAKAAQ